MASPSSYTKRRSPPSVAAAAPPPSGSPAQPRSKPTGGGFFCKSVLFGLFLLALPLFPSQAPDFVGETVLTKFWELIHLLFVGIAVAYGLFSRRNVESSVDLRMSRVDESSLSYVSRIFQVSSVFDEEELESSCGFVHVRSDESRSIHVSARTSLVVKERNNKSESFVVESELEESSSEYGRINQVQAWNSQYSQGRSNLVVARPAYGLDGHVVHQPLGLPVRSLRSALRDNAAAVVPPPPLPPQDGSFSDSCDDGAVDEQGGGGDESLADTGFDEAVAAAPSSPWHSRPETMGMGDDYLSNFQPLSVDETQYATLKSRSSTSSSSSSSQASSESNAQNRFSPSRSVSGESLNSNVDESVKEKSLQGSSRSSSPSLPPSPPLSPSPPSPEVATDDTHRRVLHSRHYSDGSLVEEDVRKRYEGELEGSQVRGRRTEFFSKKEPGSKSLNLTGESSRRGKNKSRRSYPPDLISSPVDGADDSTTRRRNLQQKSDDHLFEDNAGKGLESDHIKLRVKKGRSHGSLELTAVESAKDEQFSESFPALDVLFQPTNAKASRRAMRSSRAGRDTLPVKDVTRNTVDDSVDYDKSRKKDLPGDNKEVKSNSPRCEPQSWRASSKVSSRAKSVRTIRSDRHGKNLKTDGETSDDRVEEAKVESRGRTKPRRQWRDELAIVPHQEKLPETRAKSEPEDDDDDVTEETEAEQQPLLTLEEEEEEAAAWESQSNASHDHYEVDRKADEFIAKFREQIRLQKLHSGEQPRGGVGIGRGGGGIGIIRNSHFR